MKRFLLQICLFFILMIGVDQLSGWGFNWLSEHAKGGYVAHHNYILENTKEDILIFGSSRAIHHYNPEIITDSTGLTCYNCGQDGNGIVLFDGWWDVINDRHRPKAIIYDLTPSFDILKGEDNHKYLGWLKEEYDHPGVKEIFKAVDETEQIKMQSKMYRFNSKFLQLIADNVHPIFAIEGNGFLPLKGAIDPMKVDKNHKVNNDFVVDSLKLSLLDDFIQDSNGTKLYFVISPLWYGYSPALISYLNQFCQERSIQFYDYSNNPKYLHHNEYFKDGSHLNEYGANEFTKEIIGEIKKDLTMNNLKKTK